MLKKTKFRLSVILLFMIVSMTGFIADESNNLQGHNGAWKTQEGSLEQVLLLSDGYFMHTVFDKANKQFIQSRGGTYTFSGKDLLIKIEFNTQDKDQIGQLHSYSFSIVKTKLNSNLSGKKTNWDLLDSAEGEIAGTWYMSGRKQDGKMTLNPIRPRKTLKVLTGTRFQWAAINAETKEFFGTGGGSYTFVNGKYTENIEFFSRDNSRVGASLSFDGKLVDGNWHHSGLSSAGNPIYEVWSKVPQQ